MIDLKETLKIYIDEINELNGYIINKPENLKVCFIDCGEVTSPFTHKRTDKEIEKILEWTTNLSKLDLSNVNNKIKINYKYRKQIKDSIVEKKIYIYPNKYKIIKQNKKQFKTIDFENKNTIISEPNYYKEEIKIYKKYDYQNLVSKETNIYKDDSL